MPGAQTRFGSPSLTGLASTALRRGRTLPAAAAGATSLSVIRPYPHLGIRGKTHAIATSCGSVITHDAQLGGKAAESMLRKILDLWSKVARSERAVLVKHNLAGIDLGGANMAEADLRRSGLVETNLAGCVLERADMREADLTGAYLCFATLRSADLRGATLRGSDLDGADLRHADLRGADLTGASLVGAVLTGARFLVADVDRSTIDEAQRRSILVEEVA